MQGVALEMVFGGCKKLFTNRSFHPSAGLRRGQQFTVSRQQKWVERHPKPPNIVGLCVLDIKGTPGQVFVHPTSRFQPEGAD